MNETDDSQLRAPQRLGHKERAVEGEGHFAGKSTRNGNITIGGREPEAAA